MSLPTLDPIETRVAGALVEKALATPDHYPLTLNALVAACNQKSSRDPVMAVGERDVRDAVDRLQRRGLAGTTTGSGHRVAKFRHTLDRALDLSRRELAALAVMMLRGPQTAGEIRTRSSRLADFESVEDAEEALWMLSDREEPLVARLPRDARSVDRPVRASPVRRGRREPGLRRRRARGDSDRERSHIGRPGDGAGKRGGASPGGDGGVQGSVRVGHL